ncbi:MAG: hypothetical protein MJZ98_00680 [Paludibacteraceae bacterium]|nr:hypothetical protein [Paludibacteraceae bacterium]
MHGKPNFTSPIEEINELDKSIFKHFAPLFVIIFYTIRTIQFWDKYRYYDVATLYLVGISIKKRYYHIFFTAIERTLSLTIYSTSNVNCALKH